MYKIIDYYTSKEIATAETENEAKQKKHELLKEKLKYSRDYTKYSWLLIVIKN